MEEITLTHVLVLLVGTMAGFLTAYFMKITKLAEASSAHGRDIKTLYRDNEVITEQANTCKSVHSAEAAQTIKLLTKIVDQNNLVIQKLII